MEIEAVSGDFLFLIELEIMKQHGLVLEYGKDKLSDNSSLCSLTITYARCHSFVGVKIRVHEVMYTKPKLEKLHLHFYYRSSGKLYNLLRRISPSGTDESVKRMLEEIYNFCSTCPEFYSSPFRFRAALPPNELLFKH